MAYCKVMVGGAGGECYGAGSRQECEAIVRMHKASKVNGKGETKAATLNYEIINCEGDYPVYKPVAPIPYKTNVRIPSVGELR